MGNNSSLLSNQKVKELQLLEETQIFALWTIQDVRELCKRFQNQVFGFALVEAQFESIISFKPQVASHCKLEKLFDLLDNDNDGRIDGLELLGGLTICCHASFEDKARFCFELFDFNLNASLSKKELVMMMACCVFGLKCMTGGKEDSEPDIEYFESLAEDCISRASTEEENAVNFNEFIQWARSNRDLMNGIETLSKIAALAKVEVESDDSAPEVDDHDISDTEIAEQKKMKEIATQIGYHYENKLGAKVDQSTLKAPWKSNIFEPTNRKLQKNNMEGPTSNLELLWMYGYRAQGCRNNVRYCGYLGQNEQSFIVYFSAAVGVVVDEKKNQRFYLGHKDEITCLAVHSCSTIVATGDKGSNIHIWSLAASVLHAAIIIQSSIIKGGIKHLSFSSKGDRIAVVGMDFHHTIVIHDVATGGIIASSKGISSPNTVYDIAYSGNSEELCMVGKNQILFFTNVNTDSRALNTKLGHIGNEGNRQSFFCVTYMKDDAVVGTANGEIYRFREGHPLQIVQAHGVREPVLCLYYFPENGTLLSGGKDALIKTWDFTLQIVGAPIDISEDLDGDGKPDSGVLNSAVISIQQFKSKLLFATKGGDIFEVHLPKNATETHSLTRVAWAHAFGEVWGLAAHPIRDEFATCGDDKTLRIWSIRSHEQINIRVIPEVAASISYSPSGEILCIGMNDGSVALMDATQSSLKVFKSWQHSSSRITEIKFSPNGTLLAIGSVDCNIYIYKSDDAKDFKRQAVCKGHSGEITHIDFSVNNQYIQSNAKDFNILFWDMNGNQLKSSSSMRDTKWSTMTCTLGWSVQGIWQENSNYNDIYTCCALEDIGDIVTGDAFSQLCLFKYPALSPGCLHQSYKGHAGLISKVRFSANKHFLISVGGADRSILLWKHVVELVDSDIDGRNGSDSMSTSSSQASESSETEALKTNKKISTIAPTELREVAVVPVPRSVLHEAVSSNKTSDELVDILKSHLASGDQSSTPNMVKPWKSSVVEPNHWQQLINSEGSTAVDFKLKWVHGFRSADCRNNVIYSAAGAIVFNTAQLAIAYNKASEKQQFLQGIHTDDIISIANHPAGQIFASGEVGRNPIIVVWDSKEMEILSKIEGDHRGGVSLLTFNNKGNILASLSMDDVCSLCLYDWQKSILIFKTPTAKGKTFCMCFLALDLANTATAVNGNNQTSKSDPSSTNTNSSNHENEAKEFLVTGGEKHLKFWWWQGQNVSSQRALWAEWSKEGSKEVILCVASASRNICVTGSMRGNIMIWKNFQAVCHVKNWYSENVVGSTSDSKADPQSLNNHNQERDHDLYPTNQYPHRGRIQSIWSIKGTIDYVEAIEDCVWNRDIPFNRSARYITGDSFGNTCIWRMVSIAKDYSKSSAPKSIRSISRKNPPSMSKSIPQKDLESTSFDGTNLRLILVKYISVGQLQPKSKNVSVKSVCARDGMILIGTKGTEIYEVSENSFSIVISKDLKRNSSELRLQTKFHTIESPPPKTSNSNQIISASQQPKVQTLPDMKATCLNVGHMAGEVWGLAMHPTLGVFITTGDDQTVRCWNLETNRMISYITLPQKARAVDIAPKIHDAVDTTIALNDGIIYVIKTAMFINPTRKTFCLIDPTLDGDEIKCYLHPVQVVSDPKTPHHVANKSENSKQDPKVETVSVSDDQELDGIKIVSTLTAASSEQLNTLDSNLFVQVLDADIKQWIQVLRYSFDGSLLAAGSHDNTIYVLGVKKDLTAKNKDVELKYSWMYALRTESPVTHIDFGIQWGLERSVEASKQASGISTHTDATHHVKETFDQENCEIKVVEEPAALDLSKVNKSPTKRPVRMDEMCIQAACTDYQILFWQASDGSPVKSASTMKDTYWVNLTCPFGWAVQGIWAPVDDGTEILSIARNHQWSSIPVLVTTDNFGRIRLFNYPTTSPGASDKWYKGHSSHVTNVAFSFDDKYCVTIGASDKNVFIWTTDIIEEARERNSIAASTVVEHELLDDGEDHHEQEFGMFNSGMGSSSQLNKAITANHEAETFETSKLIVSRGDEFSAVQPFKAAISQPSDWKDPAELGEEPEATLDLKFVYGYRGWDCRNNINFADSSLEIVYHVAAVGIVFNSAENRQVLNTEHDDDIICLTVHPEGHTVATGEVGKEPKIVLWDANTGVTMKVIQFHKKGVSHLGFSSDGNLLVSIGQDVDRTIAVHNIKSGTLVGRGKVGKGIDVYCLSVGSTIFGTGGKNHVKFWELPMVNSTGGELSSKNGIFNMKNAGSKSAVSMAFLASDPVSGMADGTILLWKERSNTVCTAAHHGPVTAMFTYQDGGRGTIDGREGGPKVISGGKDGFIHIWGLQFNKLWTFDSKQINPPSACAQIQAIALNENRLIIGTKACEIYEISLLNSSEVFLLAQGHGDTTAQVWGLAVHPTMQRFATASDDMTVRAWDSKLYRQMFVVNAGVKIRAIAYQSRDGSCIAVGSLDGKVLVYNDKLDVLVQSVTLASSWIQCLKYSVDASLLAVGSHDTFIYLLDTKAYSCLHRLSGHHSYISGLDFSSDGNHLQSVSGDYELLFWTNHDGKQVVSATEMRDTKWATTNCKLGWAVQGIWPTDSTGTDVNAVDRYGSLLVTGDDFKTVKLFQYPCPKLKSKFKSYKGHSEHVMNIRFSWDGSQVFSVGGLDKSILQFEVKKTVHSKK